MLRFFIIFVIIQGVLFTLELLQPVREFFVIPFTEVIAHASAWVVQLFDSNVISHGILLQDSKTGFAVSIESGCNGIEAALVLIAAILAYPAPWKHKLIGLVAGLLTIQILNLIRIISLFYLGQWNQQVFEWAHLYVWQGLIMLDALVVFLIWLRTIPVTDGSNDSPPYETA
ncbi:MAG: exosortase H [Methylococcales bacterium]